MSHSDNKHHWSQHLIMEKFEKWQELHVTQTRSEQTLGNRQQNDVPRVCPPTAARTGRAGPACSVTDSPRGAEAIKALGAPTLVPIQKALVSVSTPLSAAPPSWEARSCYN